MVFAAMESSHTGSRVEMRQFLDRYQLKTS
jgi:hypothetical protein